MADPRWLPGVFEEGEEAEGESGNSVNVQSLYVYNLCQIDGVKLMVLRVGS